MKKVLVLGATGSIGRQALEVIKKFPEKFQVIGLSYHNNHRLFEELVNEFQPQFKICTNDNQGDSVQVSLNYSTSQAADICNTNQTDPGLNISAAIRKAIQSADLIINAISGSAGLAATLTTVGLGKEIFLANKESIILAGPELLKLAQKTGATITPLDSEHHAIQKILATHTTPIKTIYLTCSGGPFYGKSAAELAHITPAQACSHPTWNMGPKISIDSATLMNKGLEIIEAMYLFNLMPEQIKVKIHPQSLIHAIVEFNDGITLAKIAPHDMRIVIEEALTGVVKFPPQEFSFDNNNYELFDPQSSPLKGLEYGYAAAYASVAENTAAPQAYRPSTHSQIAPQQLCLANELAVKKFLKHEISFLEIFHEIESATPPPRDEVAFTLTSKANI